MPETVPDTLKWTNDPMDTLKVQTDTPWHLIGKNKGANTEYVSAAGTVNISSSLKRKAEVDLVLEDAIVAKRQKMGLESAAQRDDPVGLIWDSHNYSCSYDSVFTILGDIWVYNPIMWTHEFNLMSLYANKLGLGYQKVSLRQMNMEEARNSM